MSKTVIKRADGQRWYEPLSIIMSFNAQTCEAVLNDKAKYVIRKTRPTYDTCHVLMYCKTDGYILYRSKVDEKAWTIFSNYRKKCDKFVYMKDQFCNGRVVGKFISDVRDVYVNSKLQVYLNSAWLDLHKLTEMSQTDLYAYLNIDYKDIETDKLFGPFYLYKVVKPMSCDNKVSDIVRYSEKLDQYYVSSDVPNDWVYV